MASSSHQLTYVELQNAKDAESVEFVFDGAVRHQLTQHKQKKGTFYKEFDQPITCAQLSISVRRRRSLPRETLAISFDNVVSKLQEDVYRDSWGSKVIIFKVLRPPAIVPSLSESTSTDSEALQQCPRYRILIFGQTGVGKSSLINQVLGSKVAVVENEKSGTANIEKGLTSPANDKFILHDSQGFEPAESDNHKVVKNLIEDRKKKPNISDQLHAVWLCFQVPIPTHGERPLEEHAEMFLKDAKAILGNVPVVVVFTKYDRLLTFMRAKRKAQDPEGEAARYLQECCIDAIKRVSGDRDIPHVEFSSRRRHERGHDKLIELTSNRVSACFASKRS